MQAPTGIGIIYNTALDPYFDQYPSSIDYIVLTPDILLQDKGPGTPDRFVQPPEKWAVIRDLARRWPVIGHHVGFSLGTAEYFDDEYLGNVVQLHREFSFCWHSDHLSYSKLTDTGVPEYSTCLALPVPYDEESLQMITEKINRIKERVGIPFLVENNVYFTEIPDEELTEAAFLRQLCARAGCGFLLDLHNVYVNASNFGFEARSFIDALDLDTVQEIHIAGGNEIGGIYLDSHSGACPQAVWELLDYVLPRCPRLRGVTYEIDESYIAGVGYAGVAGELARARELWNKHKTPDYVA